MIEGRPLTREVFVSKVREALSEAGLDPLKFAGHSFRIGAPSTAVSQGGGGLIDQDPRQVTELCIFIVCLDSTGTSTWVVYDSS